MIYFVAPAYNEAATIRRFIDALDAFCLSGRMKYRLIIVDDGSRDQTAEIVRQRFFNTNGHLISYQPNRGVGEAFRKGLGAALSWATDDDVIVTMESDGTSNLEILPDFLKKIEQGFDVAVGSCYAEGGLIQGASAHRIFLSSCANILMRVLFGIRGVRTYSSFYRAYRPKALLAVREKYGDFYVEQGFSCVVELLIRLSKNGARITEVPMILKGPPGRRSKMKVMQTIGGYVFMVWRNLFLKK